MVSIGEFARLGGVSVRTLRHYDEIGLLRPAQVDPVTGYRGYLASQLGQLNRILALKELGLSLTQARTTSPTWLSRCSRSSCPSPAPAPPPRS